MPEPHPNMIQYVNIDIALWHGHLYNCSIYCKIDFWMEAYKIQVLNSHKFSSSSSQTGPPPTPHLVAFARTVEVVGLCK